MKQPTTPFSISLQSEIQINRSFLESQGWVLEREVPLYESFVHKNNELLVCGIGLYGEFNITELHWANKTPERTFSTTNAKLTIDDYFKIIELLRIKGLPEKP
jgi:hypothetical protein